MKISSVNQASRWSGCWLLCLAGAVIVFVFAATSSAREWAGAEIRFEPLLKVNEAYAALEKRSEERKSFVVSHNGGHYAYVHPSSIKGYAVSLDGKDGPEFDKILGDISNLTARPDTPSSEAEQASVCGNADFSIVFYRGVRDRKEFLIRQTREGAEIVDTEHRPLAVSDDYSQMAFLEPVHGEGALANEVVGNSVVIEPSKKRLGPFPLDQMTLLFSADGSRTLIRQNYAWLLDGKPLDIPKYATDVWFSDDLSTWLVDGVVMLRGRKIVLDGLDLTRARKLLHFSADGEHVTWLSHQGDGKQRVMLDGKTQSDAFKEILEPAISLDGRAVGFTVRGATGCQAFIDSKPRPTAFFCGPVTLGPTAADYFYLEIPEKKGGVFRLVVDGETRRIAKGAEHGNLQFTPDGKHVLGTGYSQRYGSSGFVFVDGSYYLVGGTGWTWNHQFTSPTCYTFFQRRSKGLGFRKVIVDLVPRDEPEIKRFREQE